MLALATTRKGMSSPKKHIFSAGFALYSWTPRLPCKVRRFPCFHLLLHQRTTLIVIWSSSKVAPPLLSSRVAQLHARNLSRLYHSQNGSKANWIKTMAGKCVQCVASLTTMFYLSEALIVCDELFSQAVSLSVADAREEAARIALLKHRAYGSES